MRKAYKYRIYPGKTVAARIDETIETCRRVYNRLLEMHNLAYEEGRKLKRNDYYIRVISEPRKHDQFLQKVPAQVLNEIIDRMRRNWSNYFKALKAWKASGNSSPIPRPPGFKGRDFYRSFTYPQSGFKLDGNRLSMSSIGQTRVRLHRPVEGSIKTLTVMRRNGSYYAIFSCEVAHPEPLTRTERDVGIDLGISSFYATSDGDTVQPPRPYRDAEEDLGRLQKELARKKKGSSRRKQMKLRVGRLHEHMANTRRDFFYKEAKKLLERYDTIYAENLDIREMSRKKRNGERNRYSKSIHDMGWATFLSILESKAMETGKSVIRVDPKDTTQRCSRCFQIVPKTLYERVHRCPGCGLEMDRDVNAARNILAKGRNDMPLGFASV